jgi:hypothetical protein
MLKVCILLVPVTYVCHNARFKKRKKLQTLTTGDRAVLYQIYEIY